MSLFSYFLAVKLVPTGEDEPEAQIEYRYPPGDLQKADKSVMQLITQFCFPDKEKFPKLKLSSKNKKFTFVVTNVEGVKRFGYCRRELVGALGKRWPVCFCLLSHTPCPSVFSQILEVAAGLKPDLLEPFLQAVQVQAMPSPGDFIMVTVTGSESAFKFDRPEDDTSLSGFANLTCLLEELDPMVIVTLLASMLFERRIIFVSHSLGVLSNCVQAAVALLYPFVWQHVFIPVLPLGMIQFVCAPVPFIVGLLAHHLPALESLSDAMEEVILVDLDNSTIAPPSADFRTLPDEQLIPLLAAVNEAKKLHNAKSTKPAKHGKASVGSKNDTESGQAVIETALTAFFAEVLGSYRRFLSKGTFDVKSFISVNPRSKAFLEGFVGSQMWEQYLQARIDEANSQRTASGRLEKRLTLTAASLRTQMLPSVPRPNQLPLEEVLLREGYMYKFGKGIKAAWAHAQIQKDKDVGVWQLRYWKMTWSHLNYYRKKDDTDSAGSIMVTEISEAFIGDFQGKKDCVLIKTLERTYYIHSDNLADSLLWLDYIQFRIKDIPKKVALQQITPTASPTETSEGAPKPPKQKMSALIANLSQTIQAKFHSDGQSAAGKEKDRFKKVKPPKEPKQKNPSKADLKLKQLTTDLTHSFSKFRSFITKDRSSVVNGDLKPEADAASGPKGGEMKGSAEADEVRQQQELATRFPTLENPLPGRQWSVRSMTTPPLDGTPPPINPALYSPSLTPSSTQGSLDYMLPPEDDMTYTLPPEDSAAGPASPPMAIRSPRFVTADPPGAGTSPNTPPAGFVPHRFVQRPGALTPPSMSPPLGTSPNSAPLANSTLLVSNPAGLSIVGNSTGARPRFNKLRPQDSTQGMSSTSPLGSHSKSIASSPLHPSDPASAQNPPTQPLAADPPNNPAPATNTGRPLPNTPGGLQRVASAGLKRITSRPLPTPPAAKAQAEPNPPAGGGATDRPLPTPPGV